MRTENSWQWLDGNGDGAAECYYFDGNGYMLANTTTPDGYMVNADGAWMENGAVQTKQVGQMPQDTVTGVPSTSEYNANGISLAALDMINGNRESNKKYGEVAVYGNPEDEYGVEYVVKYANGISVQYYPFYHGTNADRVWVWTRANGYEGDYVMDGEKIFRDVEDFPDADTAVKALKGKGHRKVFTNGTEVNTVADGYQVQIEFSAKKVAAVNLAKTIDHPDFMKKN